MQNKTFTLSEANAILPQLKEDLRSLQELTRQYKRQYVELERKKKMYKPSSGLVDADSDPFFEEESRIDFLRMEVELSVDNFTRKGALLKMVDPGLIDFPAVMDGEDVLLCWREGEDRISHCHGWNDGFAGRKPLPET